MKGFTLIELLAVITIMATLSAIALPQYNKAVEKARATEAVVQAKAIRDGILIHLQEFPDDPVNSRSQIAWVKIPNGTGSANSSTYRTDHFTYTLDNNNVVVNRVQGGSTLYTITYTHNSSGNWGIAASQSCSESKYKGACELFTNH